MVSRHTALHHTLGKAHDTMSNCKRRLTNLPMLQQLTDLSKTVANETLWSRKYKPLISLKTPKPDNYSSHRDLRRIKSFFSEKSFRTCLYVITSNWEPSNWNRKWVREFNKSEEFSIISTIIHLSFTEVSWEMIYCFFFAINNLCQSFTYRELTCINMSYIWKIEIRTNQYRCWSQRFLQYLSAFLHSLFQVKIDLLNLVSFVSGLAILLRYLIKRLKKVANPRKPLASDN